jgi:sigma-B regulation protein RsbU (phosphoserine phosphatase)
MTARLAAYFTGSSPEQNLAIGEDSSGACVAKSPSLVAESLNRLMLEEMETDLYFTMILGHFDKNTGTFVMTQCGHPHPAVQRQDGSVSYFGSGGLPIGLIPDAKFEDCEVQICKGDRILLISDGITECPDGGDGMLGEEGLVEILHKMVNLTGKAFFEALMWDLNRFNHDKDFPDDVSAILLEYST